MTARRRVCNDIDGPLVARGRDFTGDATMLLMADRLAERLSDKAVLRQLLKEFTGRDYPGIGSSGGTVKRRGA